MYMYQKQRSTIYMHMYAFCVAFKCYSTFVNVSFLPMAFAGTVCYYIEL